ncbi:hypothetical protein N7475_006132 [Penicillium sp. IBT 31633x]|nr:hypothetical protein N7475_006132 [Penicillium sp. IBT 31633x]
MDMLIPFLSIFMGMTLWSQWFPIPGFTLPEQSFLQRMSGTFQLTLEYWAFCDLVDAATSINSGSGDLAAVSFADGLGYANSTGIPALDLGTDSTIEPDQLDSMPPWFQSPLLVSLLVLFWSSDRVTSSDPDEVVDIHPLGSGPGQRVFALLLILGIQCFLHALFVYTWRLFFAGHERFIGLATRFLEGEPQIARLQFVAEDGSSSFDREMDLLIAGSTETDEEILAWVMAADTRPDSVSHVSVLSQFRGIWVHRITKGHGEEQALGSELACDTTEPANTTYNPCANFVSRHSCDTLVIYVSDDDDDFQEAAKISTDYGAENNSHVPNPAKRRRRNRPSQAKRHREGKRAHQMNGKELQQEPSGPTAPASSVSDASIAVSQSSAFLSAFTPAFIPDRVVAQELQSGPLPPAPLSESMDIDSPAEWDMNSRDNGPPQRSRRRHRHRRHHV